MNNFRTLCVLEDVVEVIQEVGGRVFLTADADIDADGANGQNGARAAYKIDDTGSEFLANAGYPKYPQWYRNILHCDAQGKPIVQSNGVIFSKTAYEHRAQPPLTRWVDSETVAYVVVSPLIRARAKGIVLGCKARIRNQQTGKSVEAVVADIGPLKKIGEISIAAARAIEVNPCPRSGGESRRIIEYELWPGIPGVVNGIRHPLIPA